MAFFNEGNGRGGSGDGGCDGCDGSGSTPGYPGHPSIPKSQSVENIVEIKEFKINVGSIQVDVDARKQCCSNGGSLGITPAQRACIIACFTTEHNFTTSCIDACFDASPVPTPLEITPLPSTIPIFSDPDIPNEPTPHEIVLGELDASQPPNVTTQGLPGFSIGPIITCFTYRIDYYNHGHTPIVTFIIRGSGFDITSSFDQKLIQQLGSLVEPRVYLGKICLKVVKFCDTYIEARFEDIDEQKHFEAGPYPLIVKVLHLEKLKIPLMLGGLSLPELSHIGPKFPVLPIKYPVIPISNPLISLFNGLKFDMATLLVTFSQQDAEKIRAACKVL